jgi:hypothetical protein
MSNRITGYGSIKHGVSVMDISPDDLFDKIINIKFVRKSGKSFVIRSDYEPVYYQDSNGPVRIGFKRCLEKPQIKVSYRQVAQSVATNIDIEITNFFINKSAPDGDEVSNATGLLQETLRDVHTGIAGNESATDQINSILGNERTGSAIRELLEAPGDPVIFCIIQLGYLRQFPDWTDKVHQQPGYAQRYFDMNDGVVNPVEQAKGGQQISAVILESYDKSYPPDKITYFHGIVGTVETGLRWQHDESDLDASYGEPEINEAMSPLENTFFHFVTRRFLRSDVIHIVETAKKIRKNTGKIEAPEADYEQRVRIWALNNYKSTPSAAAGLQQEIPDSAWHDLDVTPKGILSAEDAKQFGIVCALSERLRQVPLAEVQTQNALLVPVGGALLPNRKQVPFNDQRDKLGAQLLAIQQVYPYIRWFQLNNGNYFFYHVDESSTDLFKDKYTIDRQKDSSIMLPMVYDISMGGTRTIRCPFIAFINPMTTVFFQSRYSLGSLVGFYYPPKQNNAAYQVMTAQIEFETAGEANLMELQVVDIDKEYAPEVDPETGEVTPSVIIQTQERRNENIAPDAWWEFAIAVLTYPNETGTGRWQDIASNFLLPNLQGWDEPPTMERMLTDLKEWNSDYFTEGYIDAQRGVSPENRSAGFHIDFRLPYIYKFNKSKGGPDVIIVRTPYMPDYDGCKKQSVLPEGANGKG